MLLKSAIQMPAGRYYVGDLCYVMHPQWEEFCDKTIAGSDIIDGEITLDNGVKVATFSTMYGDGCYTDQFGREYGVDAGLIGCIRVTDINDPNPQIEGGNIIEFTSEFECFEDEGTIRFGDICIHTGDEEEEDSYGEGGEDR